MSSNLSQLIDEWNERWCRIRNYRMRSLARPVNIDLDAEEEAERLRDVGVKLSRLCAKQTPSVDGAAIRRAVADPMNASSLEWRASEVAIKELCAAVDVATPAGESKPDDLGQDARILYAAKLKGKDRFLSLRKAAKKAGVNSTSALYRSSAWKAAVKMGGGKIPAGSKDKDGNLEAVDDREK